MNSRIVALSSLVALSLSACGGADAFLEPTKVDDVTAIRGLLRTEQGAFVEYATETFEALYEAETVRAPEWSVTGGTLMGNGGSAKWKLPKAGRHSIALKVYLVDGRELNATWTVDIVARQHE